MCVYKRYRFSCNHSVFGKLERLCDKGEAYEQDSTLPLCQVVSSHGLKSNAVERRCAECIREMIRTGGKIAEIRRHIDSFKAVFRLPSDLRLASEELGPIIEDPAEHAAKVESEAGDALEEPELDDEMRATINEANAAAFVANYYASLSKPVQGRSGSGWRDPFVQPNQPTQ